MQQHVTLSAKALNHSYAGKPVIRDLSLDVNTGQVTALVGMSGAGKTTLLRLFAGMERPESGQILAGDNILSGPDIFTPVEHRRIGLIFQDFALFPHLSVLGNVMFGLRHKPKEQRRQIAERWIEQLGLTDRKDAYPHHLSGGEQQRVAIARALAPEPVAILMDEPFSGLDPARKEQVRGLALEVVRNAGIPALLVTHDASEALMHGDRIAILDKGRLLQCDAPETCYFRPTSLIAARALGPIHDVSKTALPDTWHTNLPPASELYYRPESFRLDPESPVQLTVTSSQLAGALRQSCLALPSGEPLFVSHSANMSLAPGDVIGVTPDPHLIFAFE